MSNDELYAAGLLLKALDEATQPPEVRDWFRAEVDLLDELVREGATLLDVGCGTGRHLAHLHPRLRLGVGLDYERSYLAQARRRGLERARFVLGDAGAMPLRPGFDLAFCITNGWGTMSDKAAVLREMRRLAPAPGTRLLSVFNEASIPVRRGWYPRLGYAVVRETDEAIEGAGGFRSEHFSPARLRALVGEDCAIRPVAAIGWAVRF